MDRKLLSAVIVTAVITSLSSVVFAHVLEASPATAATPSAQAARFSTQQSIAVLKRIAVNERRRVEDIQANIDGVVLRRLKAIDDRTTATSLQLDNVARVLNDTARSLGTYKIADATTTWGLIVKTEYCVVYSVCPHS